MSTTLTMAQGLTLPDLPGAACRGTDPDDWFPDSDGVVPAALMKRLRGVCRPCPVREACLDYALQWDMPGVWAGTTRKQRKPMLRPKPRTKCPGCGSEFQARARQMYCSWKCGEKVRKASGSRSDSRRTTCSKGHDLTPANTDMTIAGHRRCRTCREAS